MGWRTTSSVGAHEHCRAARVGRRREREEDGDVASTSRDALEGTSHVLADGEESLGNPESEERVRKQLAALPAKPGVYLFRDEDGEVLYVGKAKSLRSRVRSYFQRSTDSRATIALLPEPGRTTSR